MRGIQDGPLNGYAPVVGAVVAYNTFVDCKQPLLIGFADEDVEADAPPRDCRISGNIVVGKRAPLVTVLGDAPGLAGSGNVVFGVESGLPAAITARTADPLLRAVPSGWQEPDAESPARAFGPADDTAPESDILGRARGARPDAGCLQFTVSGGDLRPLSRGDVGPAWSRSTQP
jgi:hypothetical protein